MGSAKGRGGKESYKGWTCALGRHIFFSWTCSMEGVSLRTEPAPAIHRSLGRYSQHILSALPCLVSQLCLTLCDPMDCSPPGSSIHGLLQASGLSCPPPEDLPNPGIKPRSPTLQVDSLPSEPPGKPKNTGTGSLSLFQGIFLTQEFSQGLCQILYQLSYQGSPPYVLPTS